MEEFDGSLRLLELSDRNVIKELSPKVVPSRCSPRPLHGEASSRMNLVLCFSQLIIPFRFRAKMEAEEMHNTKLREGRQLNSPIIQVLCNCVLGLFRRQALFPGVTVGSKRHQGFPLCSVRMNESAFKLQQEMTDATSELAACSPMLPRCLLRNFSRISRRCTNPTLWEALVHINLEALHTSPHNQLNHNRI